MAWLTIDVPESQIARLWRRNGIRRLTLSSSVLTGRSTDSSGIDVLADFQPQERVGFFRLAVTEEALGRLFGGRKVDLGAPLDLLRYCRDQIVWDAVVIFDES